MHAFWLIIFILASLALGATLGYQLGSQIRQFRGDKKLCELLRIECDECMDMPILPRCPKCKREYVGHSHFAVNVDQQLRNRSERWD